MTAAQYAPPLTHLLYLHGFRSSPQSAKARTMASYMAAQQPQVHWWCPQLPASPREAIAFARAHFKPTDTVVVCGSLYLIGEVRSMLESEGDGGLP